MESYYCPSCGKKQSVFSVSLGGLFNGSEENMNNFYTELSFLQEEDVILDYDSIKKCEQLRILFDEEYITDNLPSESDRLMFKNLSGFDLLPDDIKLREENEKKYLWIHNLVTLIREAVEEDNPFVQQMLSVEDPQESQEWYVIDLKRSFTKEKETELFKKLTYLVNRNELATAGEKINDIIKILDTADRCVMRCYNDWMFCNYEKDEQGRKHLMSVTYGEVNAYKRICPECATCISPYFGLYPQKIISFVGTPSSGKSTVIVSAYHKLINGRESLKGVTVEFDPRSPYYSFYQENNQKINEKLSVKKTAKGEFPSLSVLLCSDNGKKYVYTFVDVPGEYFVSPDEKKFDMYKLKIIGQSDVIYTVFAGEQFLGDDNLSEERAVMAEATDNVMNQYSLRCQSLRNNFFHDKDIKIEILISKYDAIIPTEKDYITKSDKKIWLKSVNADEKYQVTSADVDKFVKYLRESDDTFYDSEKKCIYSSKIRESNELSQKLYFGNVDMTSGVLKTVIKSMYQVGNDPAPEDIPINFVSSFGFYALENITRLPSDQKLAALQYSNSPILKDISDEDKAEIIKSFDGSGGASSQILKEHKINESMLLKWFLEYYLHLHAGDKPSGLNVFLYNMLQRTGLIMDDSSANRDYMMDVVSDKIKSIDEKINEADANIKKYQKEIDELKGLIFKTKAKKEELNRLIEETARKRSEFVKEKDKYEKIKDRIMEIGNKNLSLDDVESVYKDFNKLFPDKTIKF